MPTPARQLLRIGNRLQSARCVPESIPLLLTRAPNSRLVRPPADSAIAQTPLTDSIMTADHGCFYLGPACTGRAELFDLERARRIRMRPFVDSNAKPVNELAA